MTWSRYSPAKLKPELLEAAKSLGFDMVEEADGERRIVWRYAVESQRPGLWQSAEEKRQFFETHGGKAEALYYDEVR
eukprot:COSAG01_NODE_286_length_19421_cov_123.895663_10_plen_77_part_00